MTGFVERLRRGANKPDGAKRRPSPRELEAADIIENWLSALRQISADYENQDISHEQFRVAAKCIVEHAMSKLDRSA